MYIRASICASICIYVQVYVIYVHVYVHAQPFCPYITYAYTYVFIVLFVCVCLCVRARARVCVCVQVCARAHPHRANFQSGFLNNAPWRANRMFICAIHVCLCVYMCVCVCVCVSVRWCGREALLICFYKHRFMSWFMCICPCMIEIHVHTEGESEKDLDGMIQRAMSMFSTIQTSHLQQAESLIENSKQRACAWISCSFKRTSRIIVAKKTRTYMSDCSCVGKLFTSSASFSASSLGTANLLVLSMFFHNENFGRIWAIYGQKMNLLLHGGFIWHPITVVQGLPDFQMILLIKAVLLRHPFGEH